jgi:hypothetical protein
VNYRIRYPFIALTLLFDLTSSAQFFGVQNRGTYFGYRTLLSEPIDNSYRILCAGMRSDNAALYRVYTFSSNHVLTDSVFLFAGVSPINNTGLRFGTKYLWQCIYDDTTSPGHQYFSVLETDSLYHPITLHHLASAPAGALSPISTKNLGTGFFSGYFAHESAGNLKRSRIYKYNSSFQVLDSTVITGEINQIDVLNGQLLVSGFMMSCVNSDRLQLLVMDSNLVLTNCKKLDSVGIVTFPPFGPQNISIKGFWFSKAISLTGTRIMAIGDCDISYSLFNTRPTIVNSLLDKNLNVISSKTYTHQTMPTGYNETSNTISKNRNKVVSVGAITDEWAGNVFGPNKFIVIVSDTIGNLLWKREVGGDKYYRASSVVFCKDGGVLVAGRMLDTTKSSSNGFEQFLYKLDSLGNISTVGIHAEVGAFRNFFFENPSNEKLRITGSTEFYIELHDMQGRLLKAFEFRGGKIEEEISLVPEGIFFLKITCPEGTQTRKLSVIHR